MNTRSKSLTSAEWTSQRKDFQSKILSFYVFLMSLCMLHFACTAEVRGQESEEEAVLIIAGSGIKTDMSCDQELLYHTYQMFGTAAKRFKPIEVSFKNDTASWQDGKSGNVPVSNPEALRAAATSVAMKASKSYPSN